ncbi:MAG: flippase activity-associated protein Agl23 [Planctomycetota bacterium]
MNRAVLILGAASAVMVLAAGLRLWDLGNRPMHPDEAVQGMKFGRLLERGEYAYDPREYHGPALNYLTLPVARLGGRRKLNAVTSTGLRLLPALCGVALVAMTWLVADGLGRRAALAAAALAAVSPAMVFYSRYYIAEALLVCFGFGGITALWRWGRESLPGRREGRTSGSETRAAWLPAGIGWLIPAGVFLGLTHATKETAVVVLFAMIAGVAASAGWARCERDEAPRIDWAHLVPAVALVLVVAAGVSVLLFSSFFSNPEGPLDSLRTYWYYLGRAAGRRDAAWHLHPWHYYLRVLGWYHRPGGAVWTEVFILGLGAVGFVAGCRRRRGGKADRHLVRFLGCYTAVLMLVYSAIPYKTPWCALGFLHGMVLLAGVGADELLRRAGRGWPLIAVAGLLGVGWLHLAWQARRASFVAYETPSNPYVYAQATEEAERLAGAVRELAAADRPGGPRPVQVICSGNDYWPLPWYLRGLESVGWHGSLPRGPLAPIVVLSSDLEGGLRDRVFGAGPGGHGRWLYLRVPPPGSRRREGWTLRPNVPLRLYVRSDAWEASGGGRR